MADQLGWAQGSAEGLPPHSNSMPLSFLTPEKLIFKRIRPLFLSMVLGSTTLSAEMHTQEG
jgi:hypothetical protein